MISKTLLGITYDLGVYVTALQEMYRSFFVAEKGVNIFAQLNGVMDRPLRIGGDSESALPVESYKSRTKVLPNYHELAKYVRARAAVALRELVGIGLRLLPRTEARG